MRPTCLLALLALSTALSGCLLPPALTVVSLAADGVSLAASGKSVSDHALSAAADEDCRMWRLLKGEKICQPEAPAELADVPPPPPRKPRFKQHTIPPASDKSKVIALAPARARTPQPVPAEPTPAVAEVEQAPAIPPPPAPALAESPPGAVAPEPEAKPEIATPAAAAAASAEAPVPPPPPAKPAPPQKAAAPQKAVAPLPASRPAPLRASALSGPPVHAQFIIDSGTTEAEAQAVAAQLHGMAATIRPVRQGDRTIYQVVVGLSG